MTAGNNPFLKKQNLLGQMSPPASHSSSGIEVAHNEMKSCHVPVYGEKEHHPGC